MSIAPPLNCRQNANCWGVLSEPPAYREAPTDRLGLLSFMQPDPFFAPAGEGARSLLFVIVAKRLSAARGSILSPPLAAALGAERVHP